MRNEKFQFHAGRTFQPMIDIVSDSCNRKDQRAERHCKERSDVAIQGGLGCSVLTGLFDPATLPLRLLTMAAIGTGWVMDDGWNQAFLGSPWIATSLRSSQ